MVVVTSTAPRSATKIHSEDTPVAVRPTSEITIGSRTYPVRGPKYQVWWDVARMLEANNLAGQAAQRLAEEGDQLSEAEQRELAEQIDAMPAFGALEEAIIYGHEDENGRVHGGFLRRCMSVENWAQLLDDVDDDESDVDLPDLYHAARVLREEFQDWFDRRSQTMGLPTTNSATAKAKSAKTSRKK